MFTAPADVGGTLEPSMKLLVLLILWGTAQHGTAQHSTLSL
jgi:hypothetical protein